MFCIVKYYLTVFIGCVRLGGGLVLGVLQEVVVFDSGDVRRPIC